MFYANEELDRENKSDILNDEKSFCFRLVRFSTTSFLTVLDNINSSEDEPTPSIYKVQVLVFQIMFLLIEYKENIAILRNDFLRTMQIMNKSLNKSLINSSG